MRQCLGCELFSSETPIRKTQLIVSLFVVRAVVDRLAEAYDRALRIPAPKMDLPQIEVSVGKTRFVVERLRELLFRAIEVPFT